MDSILNSIKYYEEQQKQYRHHPLQSDYAYAQQDARRDTYELRKNIVKCFEELKNDYESKLIELRSENEKIRNEFKEVLTALTIKKPIDEEITELQARIMQLYNEKDKN